MSLSIVWRQGFLLFARQWQSPTRRQITEREIQISSEAISVTNTLNWRSPLETRYRHFEHSCFELAIASSKWRSSVQSGESPVQSGDREFNVAIVSSKWRVASSKWRSPVQSGDRRFKVAITSFKWWSPVQSGESLVQKYIIIPWPLMGTVYLHVVYSFVFSLVLTFCL